MGNDLNDFMVIAVTFFVALFVYVDLVTKDRLPIDTYLLPKKLDLRRAAIAVLLFIIFRLFDRFFLLPHITDKAAVVLSLKKILLLFCLVVPIFYLLYKSFSLIKWATKRRVREKFRHESLLKDPYDHYVWDEVFRDLSIYDNNQRREDFSHLMNIFFELSGKLCAERGKKKEEMQVRLEDMINKSFHKYFSALPLMQKLTLTRFRAKEKENDPCSSSTRPLLYPYIASSIIRNFLCFWFNHFERCGKEGLKALICSPIPAVTAITCYIKGCCRYSRHGIKTLLVELGLVKKEPQSGKESPSPSKKDNAEGYGLGALLDHLELFDRMEDVYKYNASIEEIKVVIGSMKPNKQYLITPSECKITALRAFSPEEIKRFQDVVSQKFNLDGGYGCTLPFYRAVRDAVKVNNKVTNNPWSKDTTFTVPELFVIKDELYDCYPKLISKLQFHYSVNKTTGKTNVKNTILRWVRENFKHPKSFSRYQAARAWAFIFCEAPNVEHPKQPKQVQMNKGATV